MINNEKTGKNIRHPEEREPHNPLAARRGATERIRQRGGSVCAASSAWQQIANQRIASVVSGGVPMPQR